MRKLDKNECGSFPVWENKGFLIAQTADDRFIISNKGTYVNMVSSLSEAERWTDLQTKHGAELVPGSVYYGRYGGKYRCLAYIDAIQEHILLNLRTNLSFRVRDITLHPDGKIEWKQISSDNDKKETDNTAQKDKSFIKMRLF